MNHIPLLSAPPPTPLHTSNFLSPRTPSLALFFSFCLSHVLFLCCLFPHRPPPPIFHPAPCSVPSFFLANVLFTLARSFGLHLAGPLALLSLCLFLCAHLSALHLQSEGVCGAPCCLPVSLCSVAFGRVLSPFWPLTLNFSGTAWRKPLIFDSKEPAPHKFYSAGPVELDCVFSNLIYGAGSS